MFKKYIEISSDLIKNNINMKYGLDAMFFSVYAFFSVNVSRFDNTGMITIGKMFKYLGYKRFERNRTFEKIIDAIRELDKRKMIKLLNIDIDKAHSIPFNTAIEFEITDKFYDTINYTTISFEYFKYIFEIDNLLVKKENAFYVLLFIASRIWIRQKGGYKDVDQNPEATYATYEYISKNTGLSYKTVYSCVEYLTSDWNEHKPIFKTKVCKLIVNSEDVINCPTIYAYNTKNAHNEIEWCAKLLQNNKLKFYQE